MRDSKKVTKVPSKTVQKSMIQVEEDTSLNKVAATDSKKNKKTIATIALGIGIALLVSAGYYFKGLVVAATVNGNPITRLSIIQQLEKQGGKNVLDSLITEKLIENEAKKQGTSISEDEIDQEVKKIEAAVTQQGGTLDEALTQQGMTLEKLKESIKTQKIVEKILADKTQVTDDEVNAYITENKITLTKDQESEAKSQIKEQLAQEKFQKEANLWVESLKTDASINYYVQY